MAAPLPTGSTIMALPQAPHLDPSLAVNDPMKMLQNIHVGLQLGGELARLGDMKAQIELERKQRKAEMAQTDYKLSAATHAIETLPKIVEAQRAQAEQQAAEAGLQTRLANARAQSGLPEAQAQGEGWNLTNALSGARADASSGYSSLNTPDKEAIGVLSKYGVPFSKSGEIVNPTPAADGSAPAPRGELSSTIIKSPVFQAQLGMKKLEAEQARDVANQASVDSATINELGDGLKDYALTPDQFKDGAGRFDSNAARAKLKQVRELNPAPALSKSPALLTAYTGAQQAKIASSFLSTFGAELDKLGDPSAFQKVLNNLRDEEGKGIIQKTVNAGVQSGIDPKTVQRQVMLDYINGRLQTSLNTSTEGRVAKNWRPLQTNDSNETIKSAIDTLKTQLDTEFDRQAGLVPDFARKSLSEGPMSVVQAAKQIKDATAPARPTYRTGELKVIRGKMYRVGVNDAGQQVFIPAGQ